MKIDCVCRQAGWECAEDKTRGFDHGVFVPLHFIFPNANVPVVQLSLMSNLDAEVIDSTFKSSKIMAPACVQRSGNGFLALLSFGWCGDTLEVSLSFGPRARQVSLSWSHLLLKSYSHKICCSGILSWEKPSPPWEMKVYLLLGREPLGTTMATLTGKMALPAEEVRWAQLLFRGASLSSHGASKSYCCLW